MIFFRRSPDFDPNWEVTLPMRFRNWTSGWRGAVVLTILVTSGLGKWKGSEVYGWFKEQRAERLVAESEVARERGDFQEVEAKLKQAVALLRRHPLTLRAVARYQIETHDLAVLNTLVALLKTGKATMDDKMTFARESFRLGHPELAMEAFAELQEDPSTRNTATVLALQAGQSAGEGRWQEAVTLARHACAAGGDDTGLAYAQSVLARLLLQPSSADQAEGIALLGSLARSQDQVGIEALEMLAGLAQNQPALFRGVDVKTLIDATERHRLTTPALKVASWSLRLAAEPAENRGEITQALFERFKSDPSLELRLEAARWLNQRGMHKLTLELTEPSKLESADWFALHLDANAALGNWAYVSHALSDKKASIPLSDGLRRLFELRAAIEMGSKPNMIESWRGIENASRSETAENQLYMAGYAEQIGFPAEAAKLYRRLLIGHKAALPTAGRLPRPRLLACYTGLLRTGGGAMTLEELRAHLEAFAQEFPELDEVQNDSAYLNLLTRQDVDKAAATAQRLLQKKPELLAYRTTAALAALRQQDGSGLAADGGREPSTSPETSLPSSAAIYDGWVIDWTTAQDRFKAIYAAALRAAGRADEAERITAQIKPDALRPEERRLAGLP